MVVGVLAVSGSVQNYIYLEYIVIHKIQYMLTNYLGHGQIMCRFLMKE